MAETPEKPVDEKADLDLLVRMFNANARCVERQLSLDEAKVLLKQAKTTVEEAKNGLKEATEARKRIDMEVLDYMPRRIERAGLSEKIAQVNADKESIARSMDGFTLPPWMPGQNANEKSVGDDDSAGGEDGA